LSFINDGLVKDIEVNAIILISLFVVLRYGTEENKNPYSSYDNAQERMDTENEVFVWRRDKS
jgi:hypothetical protein